MYKTSEDMTGETTELGRSVGAYPRGWIDELLESIYLHMHYKYLLEVLRAGLYAEFWRDARTGLIPFLDPAVYGRSTLEGASFVVSSAYPDSRFHGRAFQPRLSGMTTEFISMWPGTGRPAALPSERERPPDSDSRAEATRVAVYRARDAAPVP